MPGSGSAGRRHATNETGGNEMNLKRMIRLAAIPALALAGGASAWAENVTAPGLHISEICPKPDARDPNGVEAGWIEIHNTSTT